MRKTNQEITDQNIIEEILSRSRICRIAMMDGNRPYILPFNYGYNNKCLYIHCAPEGKKIHLLKQNPQVCFEIEHTAELVKHEKACNWATLYRSVLGYGDVEIIVDFEQKQKGLKNIMTHNGAKGNLEFGKKQVDAMLLLKLNIRECTGKQSSNWNRIIHQDLYNLETGRLRIKETSWEDLDNIHQLHLHPEVDQYNTLGIPKNKEVTRNVVQTVFSDKLHAERKRISWSIFSKETEEFIGEAGINLSADRFRLGEIYYNLLPQSWSKGYATETAKAIIRFGFEKLSLHRIEAGVATANSRSVNVLEKAGMTREGLKRKVLPIRGVWVDNYHYAILEDDPRD